MSDISGLTYEKAGVSIKAQNKVNVEVGKRLKKLGMRAEGLFGGAVDISRFKEKGFSGVYVICHPLFLEEGADIKTQGKKTVKRAFRDMIGLPVGILDYIASAEMGPFVADFVEGVALGALEHNIPVLGGESAQMKDTYKKDKMDAFVHVITLTKKFPPGMDISNLIKDMEQPLLIASTDGTGTKTKIIRNPEDIIYHGFNDIGAQGVRPIAFSLYVSGNVESSELVEIVRKAYKISINLGVQNINSTIWQNKNYLPGEVDIAGTVIGLIDKKDLITGSEVKPGDSIVGIGVDGLMTNGYTLARYVCDELVKSGYVKNWDTPIKELNGKTIQKELSKPHRPMTDILFGYEGLEGVLSKFPGAVKGMAHITGGGLPDNVVRMVPDDCRVIITRYSHPVPPLMRLFLDKGIAEDEMFNTFNMGVGYTLTVSRDATEDVIAYINQNFRRKILGVNREVRLIGSVFKRKKDEPKFRFANL